MTCVLLDGRISKKCLRALEARGFFPILLPPSRTLPEAISSHPDSLVFYHRGELFAASEYCDIAPYVFTDIREFCPSVRLRFTSDTQGERYPDDARMNAKAFGRRLLANRRTLSPAILNFAEESGLDIIDTRQGYPACTVLALGEDHAVTADRGAAEALTKAGINVTLIENGDISLPPYEYGFIGGASGVFGKEVFFLGDYKLHRSHELIESACSAVGYTPVSLSDEPLTDLGGLVFLT